MKIAIISGKGGSGKSTISAALISHARDVLAVDCDVDASNLPLVFENKEISSESFVTGKSAHVSPELCISCGVCADSCAYGAIDLKPVEGYGLIAQTHPFGCEGCGLCSRLCPAGAIKIVDDSYSKISISKANDFVLVHGCLNPGDDNSGKMIARMREIADKKMLEEGIELQILDGPPGIGCPVISTITGVDRIIIVCEPSLSGIADLKRAWKVASSFCHDIKIIINKADINSTNILKIREFCHENNLIIAAELPFDRRIVESQIQRKTIFEYAPDLARFFDFFTLIGKNSIPL